MSLRALVALITAVALGALLVVGALTTNFYWVTFIPVAYVGWMFHRDGLPDQGRRRVFAGRRHPWA